MSHQGSVVSAEEQRRANSHAARIAHAKARRLRTIEFQASKAIQAPMGSQEVEDQTIVAASGVVQPILDDTVEIEQSILPSPASLLASDRKDPFESFGRPFKPVEHFLLDYYVKVVIPHMDEKCNKLVDSQKYVNLMTGEWVRLTLTNVGTQCGIFLAACRHLVEQQQQLKYLQLATQYKLYCIRALQNAISSEVSSLISDGTVGIGILMAYDELWLGDISMTKCHLQGILKMTEHNGGMHTLGSNGFLERLVRKFLWELARH
ncbi:hypothetical protein V496_08885 [Pseudogymnoascus sp. VKM F-4515 (FW-2607)]|nr:hypothetical protein V496_08885 [Pseudogymnoascus sp. VKM F-4515 (FW-2607)]KFY97138.1 hypothetical protein V498_02241 [Pseudogymnoascus sp. VKM F-4517 (FW-2822)]